MRPFLRLLIAVGVLIFAAIAAPFASACPAALRTAKSQALPASGGDLCQLSNRFRAARLALRQLGISEPHRIADVIAPRFINSPDWERAKAEGAISPWKVYGPAPRTWQNWEAGLTYLEKRVAETKATPQVPTLSVRDVTELHRRAMLGLSTGAGRLREFSAIGKQYLDSSALSRTEVEKISAPDYMTPLESGRRLLRWVPTRCVDKATLALPNPSRPALIDGHRFFRDARGIERQCGFYHYMTEPRDISRLLEVWSTRGREALAEWTNSPERTDLVVVAARLQRWFVAIHPFQDGNGRISRFALDYVFASLDLPTSLLSDQNADLALNEEEWAREVGRGMVRHVEILEACAREPRSPGCNVVGRETPLTFFWEG